MKSPKNTNITEGISCKLVQNITVLNLSLNEAIISNCQTSTELTLFPPVTITMMSLTLQVAAGLLLDLIFGF